MPQRSSPQHRLRAAVFAPLGETGKVQRVEDRIIQGISAGVLRDGDRLPSEAELASSLGVATVTAREALVGLRSRGLVSTKRGRDGGTFVTLPRGDRHQLVRDRLGGMSRVELRDLAIHYGAIASSAAELAADFADQDDIAALRRLLADPPEAAPAPAGQAPGRVVGDFLLELAALSQSARLTREYVRLHTDFGSLLALAHADPEFDAPMRRLCADIAEAVGNGEPDAARHLVNRYVRAGLSRLITEHSRLTAAPAPSPTSGRTT